MSIKNKKVQQKIRIDFERFGFVFIGFFHDDSIQILKVSNLDSAIKEIENNPNCIFIQMSTARKLGVI